MADHVLKLGKNSPVTCPSITAVRRVIVPAGTRCLKMSSEAKWYTETPSTVKADAAPDTDADQFLYSAGTYSEVLVGNGETDKPTLGLERDTYWYFVPSAPGQVIYLQAVGIL